MLQSSLVFGNCCAKRTAAVFISARAGGMSSSDARLYSCHMVIGKFAEAQGLLKFHISRRSTRARDASHDDRSRFLERAGWVSRVQCAGDGL